MLARHVHFERSYFYDKDGMVSNVVTLLKFIVHVLCAIITSRNPIKWFVIILGPSLSHMGANDAHRKMDRIVGKRPGRQSEQIVRSIIGWHRENPPARADVQIHQWMSWMESDRGQEESVLHNSIISPHASKWTIPL